MSDKARQAWKTREFINHYGMGRRRKSCYVLNDTLKRLVSDTEVVSRLFAAFNGDRYWVDENGQPRRMTNKKPLLHNGGKHR